MTPVANSVRLPDFPSTPPIGWTVKAQEDQIKVDAIVPAEVFETAAQYVTALMRPMPAPEATTAPEAVPIP
ncbi:hypothetical protein CGZ80_11850 [Rhodopirellula sp. MGV]|nr:hypothetical protein CGZ80_11850 [Rhodopirellula sp. MGV]